MTTASIRLSTLLLALAPLVACQAADDAGSSTARGGGGNATTCSGRNCADAGGSDEDDTSEGPSDASSDDTGAPPSDSGGLTDTAGDTTAADSSTDVVPDTMPVDTGTGFDAEDMTDTDGDGIIDRFDGAEDLDRDGLPNYQDDDSDGDGLPDSLEYHRAPGSGLPGTDIDNDGTPDFQDLDTDGDGLRDSDEHGCPSGSTSSVDADSDRDGYIDMLEIAFASDPCDSADDISTRVDFYFELPFEGPADSAELPIETVIEKGDVVFNMDVTGSMSTAISSLQSSLRTRIIPGLAGSITDVGIGVSAFADFPCDTYGSGGDYPFRLLQRVTTDAAAAQRGTSALRLAGGGDTPESGIEALYQLATGVGRGDEGCATASMPPFDPAAGLVSGVADGPIGGAGFRDSQVRVIVHITDAPPHARGDSDAFPYGASTTEATNALAAIDAHVIGVAVGSSFLGSFSSEATPSLSDLATRTGGVVPACAWGEGADRPAGCAVGQCCTGVGGRGEAPSGGLCPLVFKVDGGGLGTLTGLDTSVISGIAALLGGSAYDITAQLRRDEIEFARSGVDTTCFIQGVIPLRATPSGCAETPIPADFDGDGTLDGFRDVAPGSSVTFEVNAQNSCVRQTSQPQVFVTYIDLVTSEGDSLGTRVVTVLVPPEDPKH